jgi:oxaloacetate decarboxylase alpha subunit
MGYPPLVTPTSQIVGTQAVMNILGGERYIMVTKEFRSMMRGEYGILPAPVNEDIRRKCIGDDEVITCRPADLLPNEFHVLTEEIGELAHCEEDVLTYALFPQVATTFFENRDAKQGAVSDEVLAAITAAVQAYGSGGSVHPTIRSTGGARSTSGGAPAVNPMVRNS